MTCGESPAFTASRIAELLGQNRKTVRDQLDPSQARLIASPESRGQLAQAWPVEALPAALRSRLEDVADEHCYGRSSDDIAHLLSQGRRRWTPPVPVGRMPQNQIDLARDRCAVLAPVMQARCGQPIADIITEALPIWKAKKGYEVADRTMRRWVERAILRDNGFGEWSRWEYYLDNDIATVAPNPDTTAAQVLETPRLAEMISAVVQPAMLTKIERHRIWAAAMNDTAALVSAGQGESVAQRTILQVLTHSGLAMAKNTNALRTTYRRKRATWNARGSRFDAIADGREQAAHARKFTLPTCDLLKLIELARTYGNQLSYAYRHAHRRGLLSAETMSRFPALPAEKSFVPHSIRRAVAPYLSPIEINGRGSRSRRLNGAHIKPDWSSVQPGDVFEFDDLTLPLYWWIEDPTSPRGFYFGAGQVLLGVDSKTGFVLSWLLIARSGYNSRDIIQLVRLVHDSYGLPREYLLFECGIWKNAKIISGEASERDQTSICEGLASLWPVRHTYTPTGKAIIERTFGLLQDRMEHIPGYTGRDMRKDCPQATKEAIDAVKAGREHPSKRFLHASQVMELLEDIVGSIMDERLGTRTVRIPGQTPREAFDARDTTSMQLFGPESEHLFKTHRLDRKVTIEGITLPVSLEGAVYRNVVTGTLLGQRVLCWVDPLDLSSIIITDMDGRNPRLIERAEGPRARGGEGESIARARRQCSAQMRFVDVLTRATKPNLKPSDFRTQVMDGETHRLGLEMQAQKKAHKDRQREAASLSTEFNRLVKQHGLNLTPPQDTARMRDVVDGLKTDPAYWRDVATRAQENIDL